MATHMTNICGKFY